MEYVEIGARRDAYSVGDIIKSTLTVGELIDILEEYEDDTPVILSHDGGYTYGAIHESRITLEEADEEEVEEEEEEEEEIEADDVFDESWGSSEGTEKVNRSCEGHNGGCIDGDRAVSDKDSIDEDLHYIVDHDESLPEDEDNELFVYQWYWGQPKKNYKWFIDNFSEEERRKAYEWFKERGMSFYDKFTWFTTGKRYGEEEEEEIEADDDFGEHKNSYDVDEAYSFKGLNDSFGGKTLAESLRPRAIKRKRK